MKRFKKKVYFHREKEENWDIEEESISRGFDTENILWLGSDVEMTVEIREDGTNKVLSVQGKDVSNLDIFI